MFRGFEFPANVRILHKGRRALSQRVGHAQNYVSILCSCVEDAGAIRKPAFRVGELARRSCLLVQYAYGRDDIRNLLSIGADILNWSAANQTRDSAQTLQSP